METYLFILICLVAFFCVLIFYLKNSDQESFTNVENNDVHYLDTRYDFPYSPPVNPNVNNVQKITNVTYNDPNDLYYSLLEDTYTLNQGEIELIKVPLQMNDPYNEILRSQDILVTPYNSIKYSTK